MILLRSPIALLLIGHAAAAFGQVQVARRAAVWSDSSPERIVSLGAKAFPTGLVVDILRQARRRYPTPTRSELMERTTSFAIGYDGSSGNGVSAVSAISSAGRPSQALGGTPDLAALDHLIRVHAQAKSRQARAAALGSLDRQFQPYRALPYLQKVAVAPTDETAFLALDEINGLATDPTLGTPEERQQADNALRSIWNSDSVRQPTARVRMCVLAAQKRFAFPAGHSSCAGIS